jgi:hypothetical protein
MRDVATIIGYVELQQAMWIGPYPPRNGPFDSDFSIRVICRVPVVREERNGNSQQCNGYKGNGPDRFHHAYHGTPSYSFTG